MNWSYSFRFEVAALLYFVFYFFWLTFLSWLASRVIYSGTPLMRAALCVGIGFAIGWAIDFVLQVLNLSFITVPHLFSTADMIAQFGVPVAVFLWQWRAFQRQSAAKGDIAEVFE